jgi:hypothetical protein
MAGKEQVLERFTKRGVNLLSVAGALAMFTGAG